MAILAVGESDMAENALDIFLEEHTFSAGGAHDDCDLKWMTYLVAP